MRQPYRCEWHCIVNSSRVGARYKSGAARTPLTIFWFSVLGFISSSRRSMSLKKPVTTVDTIRRCAASNAAAWLIERGFGAAFEVELIGAAFDSCRTVYSGKLNTRSLTPVPGHQKTSINGIV